MLGGHRGPFHASVVSQAVRTANLNQDLQGSGSPGVRLGTLNHPAMTDCKAT
jgi:hypothetical protein